MRFVLVLVLSSFTAPTAIACSCVPSPSPYACPALPDASKRDEAVFIGTVIQSQPKSWKNFLQLVEQDAGRSLPVSADDRDDGPKLKPEEEQQWATALKRVTLSIWGDILTPVEKEQIRQAKSLDDVEGPTNSVTWPGRRVRLKVSDRFIGPESPEFELATGMGGGDCGVDFQEGEEYVVSAWLDKSGRWVTSICSPTFPVAARPEYVRALRAWKKHEILPPHVYGFVEAMVSSDSQSSDLQGLSNVPIDLSGACGQFSVITDSEGRFDFASLPACSYSLRVRSPAWRPIGPLAAVDLVKSPCAQVYLLMEPSTVK
jgi:hypothetical protein